MIGRWRTIAIGLPWLWLGVCFLVPLMLVLKISLADSRLDVPPYTPLFDIVDGRIAGLSATWANYRTVLGDALYLKAAVGSVGIAGLATLLTLAIGFPLALAVAHAPAQQRQVLLLLIVAPFWTSFLVRLYAWIGLLRPTGTINALLLQFGLIDAPLKLLNTDGAAVFGIVYVYLPFLVLPLYARLEKRDLTLLEAAADLGATPWRAFCAVTLPWSLPGVAAGCLLVFIPALGEFVIPELLGGPDTLMIGRVLWGAFFTDRDWPLSAAAAVLLLILLVVPVMIAQALARHDEAGR